MKKGTIASLAFGTFVGYLIYMGLGEPGGSFISWLLHMWWVCFKWGLVLLIPCGIIWIIIDLINRRFK